MDILMKKMFYQISEYLREKFYGSWTGFLYWFGMVVFGAISLILLLKMIICALIG